MKSAVNQGVARWGIHAWMGLGLCFAASDVVTAQTVTNPDDPVAPWLRYNVGKVVVLPKLDVAAMYTDNLFSLQGPGKMSDLVTMVTPGLRLKWDENALVHASAGYSHGETLILDNSGFNSSSDTVDAAVSYAGPKDRKSTRLNSSHEWISRMPSSA